MNMQFWSSSQPWQKAPTPSSSWEHWPHGDFPKGHANPRLVFGTFSCSHPLQPTFFSFLFLSPPLQITRKHYCELTLCMALRFLKQSIIEAKHVKISQFKKYNVNVKVDMKQGHPIGPQEVQFSFLYSRSAKT